MQEQSSYLKKHCAVYVRVSTSLQRDNYSVSSQRQLGTDFCKKRGWSYELYDEVGSGASIDNRSEFSRLIDDIQQGHVGAIWCVEFTRLTRGDDEDANFIKKLCVEYNVEVWIQNDQLKFESPEDELFFDMRATIARYERRKIKERQKRAFAQKRNEGKWKNTRQYGYDQDGNVIDEQADVVRFMFNSYINGHGYPWIVRRLNEMGVEKYFGGIIWHVSSIYNMIRNPVYAGLSWNTDGELIPSLHYPAIITEDVWKMTQLRLKEVELKEKGKRKRVSKYVLSGLITCHVCGKRYYYNREKNGKAYYRHTRIATEEKVCVNSKPWLATTFVEHLVQASYLLNFEDYRTINDFYDELNKADVVDSGLVDLRIKLSDLQTKKERLVDAVTEGALSLQDVKKRMDELNDSIVEVEEEIRISEQAHLKSDSDYLGLLDAFSDRAIWDIWDMDNKEKKEHYSKLLEELSFDGVTIVIEWINGVRHEIDYQDLGIWENRLAEVEAYYHTIE